MVFTAIRNVLALIIVAAVCTAAQEVKVNSYTYANSKLTGSMTVQNLAYSKVVNVIYANTAQTWGNTCAASYTSGPDSTNKETWSFNCAIGSAGISQFYVEYKDDRILATIFQLESGFINEYTLNQNVKVDGSGLPLSVAIGRYYGDTYDGANNSKGNPWYLTTLSVAETIYRAATAYVKAGSITVTANNQKLFNGASPAGLGLNIATGTYAAGSANFNAIIQGLQTYGDKHIRRVKYHGAAGYHFNEQYNRDTGSVQGVNDLTWSYASLITTNYAREELKALTSSA
uniref:GH15-like domain-containing protein n=1 Tax=Globisporangium ultimum (strain ATCC 200006 / CBS 805.95 / DAOM BR144) TaxID=431595 RepID=K3WKF1_GLOUD